MNNIENFIIRHRWTITLLAVFAFIGFLAIESINTKQTRIKELENNISAMNDTIHHYRTKNGQQLDMIKGYISSIDELCLYNKQLAQSIEEYKKTVKAEPVVAVNTIIETVMPAVDTVFIIDSAIQEPVCYEFDFSDKYRYLTGHVHYQLDSLNLSINPEIIYADITAGIDENDNVFVMTDNPYIEIKSLSGFRVPSKKKESPVSVSLTAGMWGGYDMCHKNFGYGPGIMLGVSYKLFGK